MPQVFPIISNTGEVAPPDDWYPATQPTADAPFIISIIGPQASGKSTLINRIFNTNFPVANELGVATTLGIHADLQQAPSTDPDLSQQFLILDVEGADARARARNGKQFAARTAAFVASVSDAIMLNLWYHDVRRLDSAAYTLLRSLLHVCALAVVDGTATVKKLLVVVRDSDVLDDGQPGSSQRYHDFRDMIVADVTDIWEEVALHSGLPVGQGASVFADVIDIDVLDFPHMRHEPEAFESKVQTVRSRFENDYRPRNYPDRIPADEFPVYAATVWESSASSTHLLTEPVAERDDDFYAGEDFAIVAAFRCDEIFSQKLSEASGEMGDLLDMVESGSKVTGLGSTCDEIVNRYLHEYDVETTDFADEPVYERKRTELEAIIDTGLMSVFMKNIAILAREALTAFKNSINEEIPADFAHYKAVDTFVKEAEDSVRRGSSWSFETEHVDLQSMMTEIASQQRKLRTTQVNASEQQSKAIQFLRMQHAQMQAVQQQAMGGGVGQWNVGAAYRPPDSNVNLSLAYQQGRTNLQVSMVPDESSTLLGPSGFTNGVGPGNLGLSFNVNF